MSNKEDVMRIDRHNLDKILSEYAYEYQEATKNLPEAQEKVALAKLNVDTIKANLYISIKQEMVDDGQRVTEKSVDTKVAVHEDYLLAQKNYLSIKRDFSEADRVNDLYMRKDTALKGLVALFGSQYWAISDSIDMGAVNKRQRRS